MTWTNKTHCFLLIYFNSKRLHVSGRLAAHHQGDQLCIDSNRYQWRTQEFRSGGVQQIQLRTEDRETGDLAAVDPSQGLWRQL